MSDPVRELFKLGDKVLALATDALAAARKDQAAVRDVLVFLAKVLLWMQQMPETERNAFCEEVLATMPADLVAEARRAHGIEEHIGERFMARAKALGSTSRN